MKKFLVLIEKWMFPFLISASLILFVLTIYEKQNDGLADNPFQAAVQALTLDSTESGFTLYMNFTINLTLAWTVLKVLMASAGLKFDNSWMNWSNFRGVASVGPGISRHASAALPGAATNACKLAFRVWCVAGAT